MECIVHCILHKQSCIGEYDLYVLKIETEISDAIIEEEVYYESYSHCSN